MKSNVSRNFHFDKFTANQLSVIFRSMSHPTRIELIGLLIQEEFGVDDLAALLGTDKAVISKHLRFFHDHKLLNKRRTEREVRYSIADSDIKEMFLLLLPLTQKWNRIRYGIAWFMPFSILEYV
ncbi:metalloregulator ArsR/SmtB family transcription factor [Cohnella sp. CFH 77786]|uniref:ArsR/SmtB family transcription factor n=1 Tax=Cohnella sp. CFH 77786 TaxID=2662265 RepID=UPI001C60EB52|nr:metalloregulator ArsR/SmtB family transcription factor [Cohnella sp. CFH 77786]MBW5448782.1 metalloregulator ArsR/SmtB family transcription factor [Cohnella sp. CFH 77786]